MSQFMYPMKPVPVPMEAIDRLDLPKYHLEVKLDGWRAVLTARDGKVALWTRMKTPIVITPFLQAKLLAFGIQDGTVLDGEIWNPLKRGGWTVDGKEPSVLTFWDCVRDGTRDLSARPLEERRAALEGILGDGNGDVRIVEQEEATGARVREVYEEASAVRRESRSRSGFVHGVVLKLRGSPRRDHATVSKEHPDWLKVVFPGM